MKRGTTPSISVSLSGIDEADISSVEFLFKQYRSENAPELVKKTYSAASDDGVSFNRDSNMFDIPLNRKETRRFKSQVELYMDTRVTLTDGTVPETEITMFEMNDTLFGDD